MNAVPVENLRIVRGRGFPVSLVDWERSSKRGTAQAADLWCSSGSAAGPEALGS